MTKLEKLVALTKYATDLKLRLSGKTVSNKGREQGTREFLTRDLAKTEQKISDLRLEVGGEKK